RYAYELAGATKVVRRAKAFQDVLGEHQDSAVAEERLRTIAGTAPSDQAVAAGLLIASERVKRAAARAAWPEAWRALERAVDWPDRRVNRGCAQAQPGPPTGS